MSCSHNGHLPYLQKHALFETGKSGQWVTIKEKPTDATPSVGEEIRRGKSAGTLTAYCPNCYIGLIEQFD